MMPLPRFTPTAIVCIAGLLVGGCATHTAPYARALEALWTTGNQPALPSQPDPAYRYLRIQASDAPPALLVLGYEDPDPLGPIEVWYSASQEVIKIQHGRIVGTAGLPINWDRVQSPVPPPSWQAVPTTGSQYQRLRDLSPGYRANLVDPVTIRPHKGQPDIPLPASLPSATAASLQWFREDTHGGTDPLPTAWFAWGPHRGQVGIVYSHQCLSPQYCLQLQRWPQEPTRP